MKGGSLCSTTGGDSILRTACDCTDFCTFRRVRETTTSKIKEIRLPEKRLLTRENIIRLFYEGKTFLVPMYSVFRCCEIPVQKRNDLTVGT